VPWQSFVSKFTATAPGFHYLYLLNLIFDKKMKKILILGFLWIFLSPLKAQWQLSNEAKISVLISEPHDEAVFTVFGHAAFRVHDPTFNYDMVFNYGIFDFSNPNFILRFALGHTDYKLMAYPYANYIGEYILRGSEVTELVLNLSSMNRNALYAALMLNATPENRVYRYNFFFDNCATRLPLMLEKSIEGEVVYHDLPEPRTFRQMVHDCTKGHAWLTFGIDLALGSPADRMATPYEMMFLPEYVKQEFLPATILYEDGEQIPLVEKTNITEAMVFDDEESSIWNTLLTPLVCGWILFAITILLTGYGALKGKSFRGLDVLLFGIAGIAGCVLFFLCFVSVHPCIWPNWSVIWLHPLHLIGVVLFCLKKTKKAAYYYHFINFAALLLLLIGWFAIPQQMNTAFIPFIATLAFRSGWNVFCYKKNI